MKALDDEITRLQGQYESLNLQLPGESSFSDLPLSRKTFKGLNDSGFTVCTEIQRESIPHALLGKDVVAVAETGSGKTLAFLVPVLERLFINKWTRTDGIACLIISPTRELAYQLFETLRNVGKYHDFSVGLIIGGKNLKFERSRMDQCNILICTPGRLLQHMDENPLFDASNMEILVLDEADRCLDKGFAECFDAILKNLPLNRQTLLFSATTTSSADFLTRLNLQNPTYVGRHWQKSKEVVTVPKLLKQNYVVVELEKKITVLWSFIKNHSKQKILVFLSSCKQVKYIYEIFSKLRPGISLLALYGTLSQDRRISIYNEFFKRKYGVLLATDLASRGLDFPNVNWVVQLDCPEDVSQYVHRGGRSARNNAHGENLLVLMPTEEEEMIKELKENCIELRRIEIDSAKLFSPNERIRSLAARSPELKQCAKRAFLAYVKSVFLMKNKKIFDVKRLHLEEFADSLGLLCPPRIRFLERYSKNITKDLEREELPEENFLTIKKSSLTFLDNSEKYCEEKTRSNKNMKAMTKVSLAKKTLKKNIRVNQLRHFDETKNDVLHDEEHNENGNGVDLSHSKSFMIQQDKYDKVRFQEIVKSRHRSKKAQKRSDDSDNFPPKKLKQNISSWSLSNSDANSSFSLSEPTNPKTSKEDTYKNIKTKIAEDIASQLLSYT